jgi:hypothetical protein
MRSRTSIGMILALGLLAAAMPWDTAARAAAPETGQERSGGKETYTGSIVGVGGGLGGRTWNFTMTIDSYNTQGEALEYAQILQSQGQDDLLKAIQKSDHGTFAVAGQIGRDLNFVYQARSENGRRIIALFDRWESTWELRYGTRTLDYPFTYIELTLDSNGKGGGTLIPLARVYFDKKDPNLLNIENFGVYPLRLVNVKRES